MGIKKIIIAFSLLIIIGSCKNISNSSSPEKKDETANIENTLNDTVTIKSIEYFEESSEGGQIDFYVKNDDVFKIKVDLYGVMGNVTKNIYVENEHLLKLEQIIRNYDKPFYEASHKMKDSTIVIIHYLKNEIQESEQEGKKIDSLSLNKIATQATEQTKKYLKLFKKQ